MKSIFIGTRLEALRKLEELTDVTNIVTIRNCYVDKNIKQKIIVNNSNIKNINLLLKESDVDLIFSSGYPFILPKEVINSGKLFVNSHPSYLPEYKGRKCIQRAFENNENFYGCTVHYMNEYADEGKIIYQKKLCLKNFTLNEIYKFIFSKLEVEVIEKSINKILKK